MAEYRVDYAFVAVPEALLAAGLDSSQISAYVAVRSFCHYGRETGAQVSDPVAAKRAGLGPRAFRDARARLRRAGWLEWERTGRSNRYLVRSWPEASASAPLRTAETAEQSGSSSRSDRQQPPAHTIEREAVTQKQGTSAAPVVPPGDATTWLTPYIEAHEAAMGGEAPATLMAGVFKRLERRLLKQHPDATLEQVRAAMLRNQRHYLATLSNGRAAFLSYPKFAQTFDTWRRPSGELAPEAEATALRVIAYANRQWQADIAYTPRRGALLAARQADFGGEASALLYVVDGAARNEFFISRRKTLEAALGSFGEAEKHAAAGGWVPGKVHAYATVEVG